MDIYLKVISVICVRKMLWFVGLLEIERMTQKILTMSHLKIRIKT